ncbi:hypothetical protein SEA_LEOPARD_16 [Mycobacterium phage Leopard]|nr:hypothetical protein SEA_LEOPARD_16 [Mycobacterium phage Leopard]
MPTVEPITPNWLSATWDRLSADDPSLQAAYDLRDYPSEQSGEGNWIDLYLTESDDHPVGRLWLNPDTENIGLIMLPGSNIDYITKAALELRQLRAANVDVFQAYTYIKSQFYAHAEQTGDLADASIGAAT